MSDLKRAPKICQNPRGPWPRGCGKKYEGWVFVGQAPIPSLRQQMVTPEGEVWGLCTPCVERWHMALAQPVAAVAVPETYAPHAQHRTGEHGDAWEAY